MRHENESGIICPFENGCGFLKILKSVNPDIVHCLKPDPNDCFRNAHRRGNNVEHIQKIVKVKNLHALEDVVTRQETMIIAKQHGYFKLVLYED